jgi:hypothetical protein
MFDNNSQGQVLGFDKIVSQLNIQFLKFFLLNRWTTICYPHHSFVR